MLAFFFTRLSLAAVYCGPYLAAIHDPNVLITFHGQKKVLLDAGSLEAPYVRQLNKNLGSSLIPARERGDPSPIYPDTKTYVRRLVDFANEDTDERAVATRSLPHVDGKQTTLKMHLTTGELLATDGQNQVATYYRFPVGARPFGKFTNVAQIFDDLSGVVSMPQKNQPPLRLPRFTAGEPLGNFSFRNDADRLSHFKKHVMRLFPGDTLEDLDRKLTRGATINLPSDFPDLRTSFFAEWKPIRGDAKREDQLMEKYAAEYEKRAQKLVDSSSPQVLTITRKNVDNLGPPQMLSYRFDPTTSEMVVLDRGRGNAIVTYYRVKSDMREPNLQLEKLGLPPVANPTEYFFSMGTAPE